MSEKYIKQIIKQALPTFIGQQLVNGNTVADTMMIAHMSMIQLASLGIGINIYVSLYVPFMAILLGIIPLISHASGIHDNDKITSLMRQGSILSLLFSLISILFFIFPTIFFTITHSTKSVNETVQHYLYVMAFGIPAVLLFRVFFSFFSGIFKPYFVMYINFFTLIIKIALNIILIYFIMPEKYSTLACAISTCTVSWISVIISIILIKVHPELKTYSIIGKSKWINFKECWEILRIGIPIGITFLIDFTFFTVTGLFIARLGTVSAAANQIASNLCYLIYLIPLSLSTTISALTAKQLGMGNMIEANNFGAYALKSGAAISFLLAFSYIVLNHFLVSLYTTDPVIADLASSLLILVGIYHFFDALLTILAGILRGYKRTLIPTIIFAISLWPIGLGGGYYLAFHSHYSYLHGPQGFWVALIISVIVAGMLMLAYYKSVTRYNQFYLKIETYGY